MRQRQMGCCSAATNSFWPSTLALPSIRLGLRRRYNWARRGNRAPASGTSGRPSPARLPCSRRTIASIPACTWSPDHEPIWTDDLDSVSERWLGSLGDAVWKYYECAGRKPVLADFTAGEDARLLVAQCHKLGIPFTAQVTGLSNDVDVVVATRASRVAGFDLNVRAKRRISPAQLVEGTRDIIIDSDAYLDLYKACTDYATDAAGALDDYSAVKYLWLSRRRGVSRCGPPPGEGVQFDQKDQARLRVLHQDEVPPGLPPGNPEVLR